MKNKNGNRPSFFELLTLFFEKNNFLLEISALITFSLVAVLVATKLPQRKEESFPDESYLFVLIPVVVVLGLISRRLFRFLNNDNFEKKNETISTILLRQEILEKQKNIENTIKEALNKNPNILKVEETIYDKIVLNLEDSLLKKLEKRFHKNIESEFIINSLTNELIPLTRNIEKYIDRIQRNSIVNLFIGIIGTITAITILAFAILTNREFNSVQIFLIHFLPRFTFVIFIQLFAFFFLKLYKNNLEDAKYFQNELTNLTAKSSSIKISYLLGKTDDVSDIIKELATTERNFRLLKNETTISLEKAKIDNGFDKSIIDQIKNLIPSTGKSPNN